MKISLIRNQSESYKFEEELKKGNQLYLKCFAVSPRLGRYDIYYIGKDSIKLAKKRLETQDRHDGAKIFLSSLDIFSPDH